MHDLGAESRSSPKGADLREPPALKPLSSRSSRRAPSSNVSPGSHVPAGISQSIVPAGWRYWRTKTSSSLAVSSPRLRATRHVRRRRCDACFRRRTSTSSMRTANTRPLKNPARFDCARQSIHSHDLAERCRPCLVANRSMPQPPSSVMTEIAWLGFFLVIFVAAVYLLVRTLVPHHFNDNSRDHARCDRSRTHHDRRTCVVCIALAQGLNRGDAVGSSRRAFKERCRPASPVKGRRETNRFAFEGPTLLEEAHAAAFPIEELYVTQAAYDATPLVRELDEPGTPTFLVEPVSATQISDPATPPGIVAVAPIRFSSFGEIFARTARRSY